MICLKPAIIATQKTNIQKARYDARVCDVGGVGRELLETGNAYKLIGLTDF